MTIVGIHLCDTGLRRAELRRSDRGIRIVRLDCHPSGDLSTGIGEDPSVIQDDSERKSIAALPNRDILSRSWALPAVEEAKCKQMVAHRLEAALPIPMDQLTWSYRRRKGGVSANGNVNVLAQAVKKDRIASCVSTLSDAGLNVDILTTETEALGAFYRHGLGRANQAGPELLVLANKNEWLAGLFEGGMVRSVRRITISGNTALVASQECRHVVEHEISIGDLKRVLWCGSQELDNHREALSSCLGVAVQVIESGSRFIVDDGTGLSAEQLSEYGVAIGLALAGLYESDEMIRLAGSEEIAVDTCWPQRLERWIARPRICVAAAAGLVVLATLIHVGALALEKRNMARLMESYQGKELISAKLVPKIQAKQRLEKYRIDVEEIYADLCTAIPESMIISSIQLSRDRRMVIKGTAGDPKTIFALADALRKGDRFDSVQPDRTTLGKQGGFTITANLVGIESVTASKRRGRRP